MKKVVAAVLLSACSLTLAGCQTSAGSGPPAVSAARYDPADLDMSDYFVARLQDGRHHLLRGRLTQAIHAYRQASHDPARAGEAYNGMGVAFANLGRADLANRYFSRALNADPDNARYQRNLARLDLTAIRAAENRPGSTGRTPGAQARAEPAPGPSHEERQPLANEGNTETVLVRTSRHEVRLLSRAFAGGPARGRPSRVFHIRRTGREGDQRISAQRVVTASLHLRFDTPRAHPFGITVRERLR